MNVIEQIEKKLKKEFEESKDEAILVLIEKSRIFRRYSISELEDAIEKTIAESNEKLLNKGKKPFIYRSIKIQMLDVREYEDKQLVFDKFKIAKLPIVVLYQNRKIRDICEKILFNK